MIIISQCKSLQYVLNYYNLRLVYKSQYNDVPTLLKLVEEVDEYYIDSFFGNTLCLVLPYTYVYSSGSSNRCERVYVIGKDFLSFLKDYSRPL